MRQTVVVLIVIGILVIGCSSHNTKPKETINELDSLDYVVISSAINQYFIHPQTLSPGFGSSFDSLAGIDRRLKREDIRLILIEDSTITHKDSISKYVHKTHNQIDSSDRDLIERIIDLNRIKYRIDNSKIKSFKTHQISQNGSKELLDSLIDFGYEKKNEINPKTYGLISLTRPAFSDNRNRAIIYVLFYKRPKWAGGYYLWLKKVSDKWIAYDIVSLWVS